MIRAIIIEDEEYILNEIRNMLQETGFISVVRAYGSALEALNDAESADPQLAIIDIGMPIMDGITLAEKLLELIPALQIVFVTAYNEYAVKAFELNALDYLLKPINTKRFAKMVQRIAATVNEQDNTPHDLLEIQCFGSLDVKIGGQAVKWVRSKAEELFCYLLVNHGMGVHKETILETLWPEHDLQRALPLLQTSVCKLRSIFSRLGGKVSLEYASSKYCLTITESVCDLFFVDNVFSNCLAEIIDYSLLERAGEIVVKGFLKGQGYLWAMEKEEQLRNRLSEAYRYHIQRLTQQGDWHTVIRLLKLLLEAVPYDEQGNNLLLECFDKLNDKMSMARHYQWLKRVLWEQYDMEPTISTTKLYLSLSGQGDHRQG